MMKSCLLLLAVAVVGISAEVYYKETFDNLDGWTQSENRKDSGEAGDFELTAGEWYGDAKADLGAKTSTDARFYSYSAPITTPFSNKGKTLVLQFSVKFAQKIDCGGGYIKVIPAGLDQASFNGDSDYNIMFGPDVCGTSTKRVHAIFNYKGENLLTKKTVPCETDQLTHVYTLIVNPDLTYEIRIDGDKKESGSLEEDWDFLAPKMIKDPEQSKPTDWVDDAMMDDPEDEKPAGYDDIEEMIVDPEAEKPEGWEDDEDGEWIAPMIDNPEYQGEYQTKRIANPDYQGPWVHPEIENPDYAEDADLYAYDSNAFVGFEIWQVKAGTIFDNIIITDSVEEAEAFMAETFEANKDAEKKMFDDINAAKQAEEEAERERLMAEAEEEEEDDDDDDDEDDDDEEEAPAKDEL